ncbi:Carrier domain-containing protein OS=Streptomyces microflavus OX=1919 GN=Smic_65280 PE=4 SV=1 [Streptomyces microflavus]
MDRDWVLRIMRVVSLTFEFSYTFRELRERRIAAPITIFKAQGDNYSFLDGSSGFSSAPPTVVELAADHYAVLREGGVDELVAAVRRRLAVTQEAIAAHVGIKHAPVSLRPEQWTRLLEALTETVTSAFSCEAKEVSIAFEAMADHGSESH